MKPKDFDIKDVIKDLKGTCHSIQSALPEGMELEDLTSEDYNEIDCEIRECPRCGWWTEVSCFNVESDDGEEVCDECYEGEEYEDD